MPPKKVKTRKTMMKKTGDASRRREGGVSVVRESRGGGGTTSMGGMNEETNAWERGKVVEVTLEVTESAALSSASDPQLAVALPSDATGEEGVEWPR